MTIETITKLSPITEDEAHKKPDEMTPTLVGCWNSIIDALDGHFGEISIATIEGAPQHEGCVCVKIEAPNLVTKNWVDQLAFDLSLEKPDLRPVTLASRIQSESHRRAKNDTLIPS
jgi:hypothetical protein